MSAWPTSHVDGPLFNAQTHIAAHTGHLYKAVPGCENTAGKLRQEWYATAGKNFTKPGHSLIVKPCNCFTFEQASLSGGRRPLRAALSAVTARYIVPPNVVLELLLVDAALLLPAAGHPRPQLLLRLFLRIITSQSICMTENELHSNWVFTISRALYDLVTKRYNI